MSDILVHAQQIQSEIAQLLSHTKPSSEMNYNQKKERVEIKFTSRPGWIKKYLAHVNISQTSISANFAPPHGIDINTFKISKCLNTHADSLGITQREITFDTQSKQVA